MSDGKVWWCRQCQYTIPRWYGDTVKSLMEGGVICPCDNKMELKLGTWVSEEYKKELSSGQES